MRRLLRWWRQQTCDHRSHGQIGGSPALKVWRDLIEGRITIEEYRRDRSPLDRTECMGCGKVWER